MSYAGIVRISILGNPKTGKKSIINSFFIDDPLKSNFPYDFTIKNYSIDDNTVKVYIYMCMPKYINSYSYFHICNYIIFILDMSNIEKTLNDIVENLNYIKRIKNNNAKLILAQTKSDICNIDVYSEYIDQIIKLCEDNDMTLIQTSSINNNGIDNLFTPILNEYYYTYL
jgi:hypothetical protein